MLLMKNFLGPKIRYLDRYKYPKNVFLRFLRFLGDLVSILKAKKWYISDLLPGLKKKKLIFILQIF
jgi:hypothetical protein